MVEQFHECPMSNPSALSLSSGPFELELAPGIGGSVLACRYEGVEVLRTASRQARDAGDPLGMAAFVQIPFAGRIAHGTFDSDDLVVRLPPNFPPEPHAIHGQAWQNPWVVDDVASGRAVLSYEHPPDAWPWHYRARQQFALDGHALTLQLAVTNLGPGCMPAGLGWHPYFPAADARLQADVVDVWPPDGSPPRAVETLGRQRNLRRECPVTGLGLDHAFTAGRGGARLAWPTRRVALAASAEMGFLVIYAPAGEPYFCVEPLSHVPDAVNRPLPASRTGLRRLAPGETLSASVVLQVELPGRHPN
jgi:aldose 1-epimerase